RGGGGGPRRGPAPSRARGAPDPARPAHGSAARRGGDAAPQASVGAPLAAAPGAQHPVAARDSGPDGRFRAAAVPAGAHGGARAGVASAVKGRRFVIVACAMRLMLSSTLLLVAAAATAAEPPVVLLWPGVAPGSEGKTDPEKITSTSTLVGAVTSVH